MLIEGIDSAAIGLDPFKDSVPIEKPVVKD
jgi:hypothetical protein